MFHSENESTVFRPLCAGGIWKCINHRPFWICVWRKLGQENHLIIVTTSSSKSSAKCFPSTKRKSRRFQIPLVWRTFSKSSVLVWTVGLAEEIKLCFQIPPVLKEQCHEDFAVLGQICAKIVTLRLKSLTKCFSKAMTKISSEFYQRGLTIINFLRIFGMHTCSIKTLKNGQFFQVSIHFHPCHS